jgi:steroid 5-alpha reductase family enzyme
MIECDILQLLEEEATIQGSQVQTVLLTCLFFVMASVTVSEMTGNYSQVDKLWSLTPCIYSVLLVNDDRSRLMAAVATVWSVRLTYNFYRRGGYTWPPWLGEEDYRWSYIRSGEFVRMLKNPTVFRIFNLTFISFYQHLLLLLIASPAAVAHIVSKRCEPVPLQPLDWFATALVLVFVWIEAVADYQQYAFQTEKYRLKKQRETVLKGDFQDGFCQSGLFAIVRKPNYAAEQGIWMSFHLYAVSATGKWFNCTDTGWILLILLFQGTGWFTEKLSCAKYPAYADYQKQVPLYVPRLFPKSKRRY